MTRAERARHELDIARAYRRLFTTDAGLTEGGRLVLDDLSTFCRIREAGPIRAGDAIDPAAHVYRDGMRSVWEHISKRLAADIRELEAIAAEGMDGE